MVEVIINDEEIAAMFARISDVLTDLSEPMGKIAEAWLASTQDRVSDGIQPDGKPFTPRSPTTIETYRRKNWPFGLPLNRSGEMRKQLHVDSGPDFAEIGSDAVQAAVMQFGSKNGDIPARPFLGVSDKDRDHVIETIEEWLIAASQS